MRKSELSSAIKTARDIMRKDAGLSTDVDRIPQLSWILFLKCFDDLEQRRMLLGGKYRDKVRIYADTPTPEQQTPEAYVERVLGRKAMGLTR